MFLSLDDDFRALEFTAQLGIVAIDLLNLPRLCIGLRSALAYLAPTRDAYERITMRVLHETLRKSAHATDWPSTISNATE